MDINAIIDEIAGTDPTPAPEKPEAPNRTLTRADMLKEYQANILRSGQLRAEILKGAAAGEDPIALLLKAGECIGRMTDDKMFLKQLQANIEAGAEAHRGRTSPGTPIEDKIHG